MNILVTGGLGYIGSNTIIELIENNHKVVIVDDLSNSNKDTLNELEKITCCKIIFYEVNSAEKKGLERVFCENSIDGVIHFAGYKSVSESIVNPLSYYRNNLVSTINLCELCIKYKVGKFVFSSSATVYGEQHSPLYENTKLMPTLNPYGETKVISERIIRDVVYAHKEFAVSILRYFNPVGAHKSGLIGECPNGVPNNLMPYITKVAKGILPELKVYGNDYDTIDGTGVRDYIHVCDLARGHVNAIENTIKGVEIYNLGTGKGTSVLQLINTFEKVNKIRIPYEIVGRREGDTAICIADVSKAQEKLRWKAELSLEDMVRDAWAFESQLTKISK